MTLIYTIWENWVHDEKLESHTTDTAFVASDHMLMTNKFP